MCKMVFISMPMNGRSEHECAEAYGVQIIEEED